MNAPLIYDRHTNTRKLPVNIKEEDKWLFHAGDYISPVSKFSLLKNVFLTSEGVIIKNGFPVKENITCYEEDFKKYRFRYIGKVFLKYKKKEEIREKAIIFFDNYSDGFAHWMIDTLTRVVEIKEVLKDYLVILPPYVNNLGFYRQSLALFDIQREYILPASSIVHIKELMLPSHIAPSGSFNENNVRKLKEYVLNKIDTKLFLGKNIYISRKKATRRYIVNEEEVSDRMAMKGFAVVCMENYTFSEQVSIVAQADNVVSIHGAALSLTAFMKEGSRMLEFRRKDDDINNVFYNLACAANVHYYYQLCEAKEISSSANNFNLTVDLKQLDHTIDFMLSS